MTAEHIDRRLTARHLTILAIVALTCGWIGRVLDGAPKPEGIGVLIWIVAPVGTALMLRAFAGAGWRDLGIRPAFRGNLAWYGLALVLYPAVVAAVVLTGTVHGSISSAGLAPAMLGAGIAAALAPSFLKNILEEFAWRGFLTPKIHSLGMNDLIGHAIVGLIWGLWHLPYFLFFLEPAAVAAYTSVPLPMFIVMGVITMMSWALVYGELRLMTGSVWPAVLMHTVEDSFVNELLLEGHIEIAEGTDWLFSPGFGLLNILLFGALGVGLYRFRTGGGRVA
jgi:membrane protease YdiL (CAAX protease family)